MARKRPFRIGRSRTAGTVCDRADPQTYPYEYRGRKLPNDEAEKLEARGNRYLYEIK